MRLRTNRTDVSCVMRLRAAKVHPHERGCEPRIPKSRVPRLGACWMATYARFNSTAEMKLG
jgi:hypothetical protein